MPAPAYLSKALTPLVGAAILSVVSPSCRTIEPDPEEPGVINQPAFALIDLDGDGKVSPTEMAKHKHQEGLAEFDLDNDKQISLEEWKAAKPSATDGEESFRRLDRDKDGKLTEDEAVLTITELTSYRDGFRKMDSNADGHLHWEEYAAGDPAVLNLSLFSAPPASPSPAVTPAPAS